MVAPQSAAPSFEHDALFYDDVEAFVRGVGAFITAGVAAREPVLVAVDRPKIQLLRDLLGSGAARVEFIDMAALGGNPARILGAWEEFVRERGVGGERVRGVGEPVWAGRSGPEIVECEIHEHLLNVAFQAGQAWSLLCPYDASALPDEALAAARRTHPFISDGHRHEHNDDYADVDVFARALPEPSATMCDLRFDAEQLGSVRHLVIACGVEAGLTERRAGDAVLAVHELAANSVLHGGGAGRLRAWMEDGSLVFEVTDAGHIDAPFVGRRRPNPAQQRGRGLWMVNQLCDLVQLRSSDRGSAARVYVRR
jgi:anti-sigma regulatory factor (Ser/Thr protein kinase)